MKSYEIEVFIDGKPTYMVDVPTGQGPDAAERRAKVAIMAQHRSMDVDRIEARYTGNSEDMA